MILALREVTFTQAQRVNRPTGDYRTKQEVNQSYSSANKPERARNEDWTLTFDSDTRLVTIRHQDAADERETVLVPVEAVQAMRPKEKPQSAKEAPAKGPASGKAPVVLA